MAARVQMDVLAAAAAGDEVAFRHVIAAHHEDMRRVCAYITGDLTTTDEATQATWFVLSGRRDAVGTVGRAVGLATSGMGHRPIAVMPGRPESTVRARVRRIRPAVAGLTTSLLARAAALGWSGRELLVAPLPRLVAAVDALAGRWPGTPRRVPGPSPASSPAGG